MSPSSYRKVGIILCIILFILFQLSYWIKDPGFIDTLFSWSVGAMIILIIVSVVFLLIKEGDKDVYLMTAFTCGGTLFLIVMQVVLFQNPHTLYGVCIHDRSSIHPMVTLDFRDSSFVYQTGGLVGNHRHTGKLSIKRDIVTFRYYEPTDDKVPAIFMLTKEALIEITDDSIHAHYFEFR